MSNKKKYILLGSIMENSVFQFFDFPLELQEKILNAIDSEKGILNARAACKSFWVYFSIVNVFCEGQVIGKNIFHSDNFIYQDMEGNTVRKIVFRPYSMWKYYEYSPNGILVRIVENINIYQTRMTDYSNHSHNRILVCDSRYGVIAEKTIPKLIHPGNCVIS